MTFRITSGAAATKLNKHWQFCVGSGHAALAMRTDYLRQLKFVHDELGIERVRFHGIFNDDMKTLSSLSNVLDMIPGLERVRERTFHRCGLAYDNVLAAGMKPFVELGFMPELIARAPRQWHFDGFSNMNPPADFNEWATHVSEFIKYLIHRYGKEEVESWNFEVWNEPDLKMVFWIGTRAEYFKLYEVTAKAAKAVDEKIKIGGPATSASKWVKGFVRFCEDRKLPLDFVSTHQYSGDPLGGVEGSKSFEDEDDGFDLEEMAAKFGGESPLANLQSTATPLEAIRTLMGDESETKDLLTNVFRNNADIVRDQAKDYPLYYTEWNFSAVFSAYSNDTRKAAAYILKTALDIEKSIDGSSIWCFSDIFEEMHQFTEEFHGGFGLLTINGIPKPSFHAMKMLSQLGEERLDLGDGATDGEIGIAAFKSEGETQILLFRQSMKQLDLPKIAANVTLETDKKPSRATAQRIDEDHCNPLKCWERDGKPADLNQSEVERYISESAMAEEKIEFQCADSEVSFSVSLGVNDMALVRLIF
ncbi:MAG: hypothetical protein LBT59_24865 [Clostridiales bacterium]|jgi:xylan 1,4-beta-xylosidase|nr:hypothetical protein [Clostridiales bacterium]